MTPIPHQTSTSRHRTLVGTHAVVLGAGIAGIMAAGVAARYFRRVTVIEKDALPAHPGPRKGVPQGHQAHAILAYGEKILDRVFPGYHDAMASAGGIRLRYGRDVHSYDGDMWQPVRDLDDDLEVFFSTRPLMERVARRQLDHLDNVTIRQRTRVLALETSNNGSINHVKLQEDDGLAEWIVADLVIDCRGRGSRLPTWLEENGYGKVESAKIGCGIGYTSGLFEATAGWLGRRNAYRVQPQPPVTRGCILIPVEGDRWLAMLFGRFGDFAPNDEEGFRAFAKTLDDPIVDDCICDARLEQEIRSYRMMLAVWRRFDRMRRFPDRILPLGDAMTSFNPIHAQGMSVAGWHAMALWGVLESRHRSGATLDGIAADYLPRAKEGCDIAWTIAGTVDFAYPQTTGDRPADLDQRLARAAAIRKLMQEDAEVQRLALRVKHLLEPPAVLANEAILREARRLMAA